jgi:hypothetical protein
MLIAQSHDRGHHPQSGGTLAFTDRTFDELIGTSTKADQSRSRVVQNELEEGLADDALAPARGILNALRLSVTLWSLIALVVILMR